VDRSRRGDGRVTANGLSLNQPNGEADVKNLALPVVRPEAEKAANFYVSLLPDSRIDVVQRNVTDNPAARPAGCWS
jgi:hypothetical protein